MRTIEIRHSNHEAYCNHFNENTGRMTEALGYLTTWAPTAYQYVDIYVALDGEITACYYRNKAAHDARERPGYVIGAIFHPDSGTYSFHS